MNDKVRIEVNAPYIETGAGGPPDIPLRPGQQYRPPAGVDPRDLAWMMQPDARIQIDVRPLQGAELGALRSTGPQFSEYVRDALERKNNEDRATYGMTTVELRSEAHRVGYYESPAHLAWSEAAEARTGGKLTAEWWRGFDPFGGTSGHGPQVLAGGAYPGVLSTIGMAHDTDWSLGRHFQAGPLRELYGVGLDAKTRGEFGVVPNNPINRGEDIYSNGHPDWDVRYQPGRGRLMSSLEGNQPVAAAAAIRNDPLYAGARDDVGRLNGSALGLTSPEQLDRVTAALVAESRHQGLSRIDAVTPSTDGQKLFATQGSPDDPAHLRANVVVLVAAQQSLETSERLARHVPDAAEQVQTAEVRSRALG